VSLGPTIAGLQANYRMALVVAVLASLFDLRTRRIPNWLTFGAAGAALCFSGATHGVSGLMVSAAGWCTGCALFLPFFALGGLGAADVKLVAGIGAWLTPSEKLNVALYAMIAGGVMAVILALVTGYLGTAARNIYSLLVYWRVAGIRPLPELTLAEGRGPRLPYALPIAVGTVTAIFWR
jgi:prepilin peptidase CpaA